ncbi:hypothetical protein GALMADRAFT_60015 [Galerina marginata CBS 339.88]|uniref:Zn(2)-C6 fungal-type domain-containing protein n=1 Tax=Galerina marginata (strain CBS 339.88) TaxID=685588 RepID=A0A067TFT5_GALM3|nr:hypothetical protein GALMADRAFT_60015 [Galerina marginata CBS 339.88]
MPRKSEHTGILRRGSACLSCRRRKLRCDGGRPVCHQCSSMRRGHECTYDDSARKSRTQTLREKLFALEAKVRELEHGPGPSSAHVPNIAGFETFRTSIDDVHTHSMGTAMPQMDPAYVGLDPMYPMLPQSWSVFDYGYDGQNEISSASSSSHSNTWMPTPLDISIPFFINEQQPAVSTMAFTDSSGTPVQDGPSDRFLHESIPFSIQSFIEHRKQCCFYSNTSRFDTSSSATVYQNTPPNSALMSAIYLMGSFFARIPTLEQQLLDQSLHEVARSLHNQEQLMDGVQALCLLAQYFFFNNRTMEGIVHLTRAKRIALDFGLNQVTYTEFPFDLEYSAVFWQVFMVEKFWSASNDCCQALPDLDSPCRNITTPLPVLEGADMEIITNNSLIHVLFEEGNRFHGTSLSVPAFKIMAACIFDHSLRVHNSSTSKDSAIWSYHRSAELALERLSAVVHPFTWRGSQSSENGFDTDLFAVHSLILASTIHLHLDKVMNLKISWAAKKLVELVNHLSDDDYPFLDPVLSVSAFISGICLCGRLMSFITCLVDLLVLRYHDIPSHHRKRERKNQYERSIYNYNIYCRPSGTLCRHSTHGVAIPQHLCSSGRYVPQWLTGSKTSLTISSIRYSFKKFRRHLSTVLSWPGEDVAFH